MDNISHSLVGLAIGELVQRTLPAEADKQAQGVRRRMLLSASLVANNLPDLDLVLTTLLPAPLGNLLHHRGYSHTLLVALAQALLLIALTWLLWPAARRLLRTSAAARDGLLIVSVTGLLMHIALDYLNSYGVHPLYPFDERWLYGDTLFIVEPVIWVAFGVPLALMLGSRPLQFVLLGLLGAAVAAATGFGVLHWGSLLALAAGAVLLARLDSKRALAAAFVAVGAFIVIQNTASARGKRLLAAELKVRDPGSRLLDAALTGYPANPLCWNFVSVERDDAAGSYRLRRGLLSVAPALMPISACPAGLAEPMPVQASGIGFAWEHTASLASLRTRSENCHFHAWLRFARAPAVGPDSASDARFAMSGATNFSTFPYARFASLPCPASVPAWDLPRQDLLAP